MAKDQPSAICCERKPDHHNFEKKGKERSNEAVVELHCPELKVVRQMKQPRIDVANEQ
uniref:Uncharacterized protein n=1 Tax=Rhizophora mucronata TaxID=61149 RepID=A0A2P2PDV3_RHIMU